MLLTFSGLSPQISSLVGSRPTALAVEVKQSRFSKPAQRGWASTRAEKLVTLGFVLSVRGLRRELSRAVQPRNPPPASVNLRTPSVFVLRSAFSLLALQFLVQELYPLLAGDLAGDPLLG